tara:strand:- start:559 stop:1545 length:987 start_codon:yes stop_codon:yes gene_type:complete
MHKVGIIGFGKMGQIREKIISSMNDIEVKLIFDPEISHTQIRQAKSAGEILENPEIDSVIICTPNYLNKSLTIKALVEGKNVFCEKPPAFNEQDVIEIKSYEESSKKILMYGFNHRYHGSILKMKELVDSKEYGDILWMRGRYGKSVDQNFFTNWRANKELSGGGILIDQGIHMLDLFLYLGGDFDKIHASVSNLYWNLSVEDNVFATLENSKTGMVASLHSTMTQWRHLFSIEVFLQKGYFVLNGLKTSTNTYGEEILTIAKNRSTSPAATWKDENNLEFPNDESWNRELNEFFNAIKSKRRVKSGNSDDALKLMKIIDRIYSFSKI